MTARLRGIQLVAFDLDGTLVDSAPDLCYCLGAALDSVGLARPTEDETLSWIGDGVEELVRRGVEHMSKPAGASRGNPHDSGHDDALAAAFASFLHCYEKNLFVRTRLYPGVIRTLDALRSRGMRLCCVTNKRARFADAVLEHAGIRDRFDVVVGGDSLAAKKPTPAQLVWAAETLAVPGSAAVLVGDSKNDYAAAKAAGWPFVWAAYGYGPSPQLSGDPPGADADSRARSGAGVAARIEAIEELNALLA